SVDASPSGDDAVSQNSLLGEPEVGRAMRDEPVQLHERPGVEQHIQPLTGRHLAFLVLRGDTIGAAALLGGGPLLLQMLQLIARGHESRIYKRTDRRTGSCSNAEPRSRRHEKGGRNAWHPRPPRTFTAKGSERLDACLSVRFCRLFGRETRGG